MGPGNRLWDYRQVLPTTWRLACFVSPVHNIQPMRLAWTHQVVTVNFAITWIQTYDCLFFNFNKKKGPRNTLQSSATTQQAANYRKFGGEKYNEDSQRSLTCIFKGITTRIYGIIFNLTCSPQHKWIEQLRLNWSMGLLSSPKISQSSQFSNSMPSATNHASHNPCNLTKFLSWNSHPAPAIHP